MDFKHKQKQSNRAKINQDRIDFDLSCEHVEALIKQHHKHFENINSFDFNLFEFSEEVGRNMQMPFMATSILKHNNLLQIVDYHKFIQFFTQIYNKYKRNVQYHNDLHGSDVAQHVHLILRNQNMIEKARFTDLDTLGLLVAALCHDT